MIFPGHIAAGFLTTYSVVSFFPGLHAPVGGTELAALFAAGTLLGDAPDIDVLFYFLKKKTTSPDKLSAHRTYITHAPVVWLLLGLSIFFLSSAFGLGSFWCILGLLVWLCPWSHFLCDSIDYGVMWLWPISKKQFAVYNSQSTQEKNNIRPPQNWRELFWGYSKTPLAYIEFAITLIGLYTAFHIFF